MYILYTMRSLINVLHHNETETRRCRCCRYLCKKSMLTPQKYACSNVRASYLTPHHHQELCPILWSEEKMRKGSLSHTRASTNSTRTWIHLNKISTERKFNRTVPDNARRVVIGDKRTSACAAYPRAQPRKYFMRTHGFGAVYL